MRKIIGPIHERVTPIRPVFTNDTHSLIFRAKHSVYLRYLLRPKVSIYNHSLWAFGIRNTFHQRNRNDSPVAISVVIISWNSEEVILAATQLVPWRVSCGFPFLLDLVFEKIGFIGRDHADHEDVRSCLGEVWALAFINP